MRSHAAAGMPLALLLVLAGCVTPAADLDAASQVDAAPREPVRVLGVFTSEPAIVQHPDGTLFVAAYGGATLAEQFERPLLYRSDDLGATFTRVDQGDLPERSAGNSDTDLAVAPDGTLYHAVMHYLPWGHAIAVGASADRGDSWTWRTVAAMPWVDRPWVEVGPDGTAHVTWSSPFGLHHATSRDGGASWVEGPLVHPSGGSGGLAVGPGGELAVRVFPLRGPTYLGVTGMFAFVDPEADGVAVSRDGGESWTFTTLPGTREYSGGLGGGDETPRWADPLAFDAAGTLYAAWGEKDTLQLGVSRDLAETWNVTTLATADEGPVYFPYLDGGAHGELAATWFSRMDTPMTHVAHVLAADTPTPVVDVATQEMGTATTTRGEYFQATLLQGGGVGAAIPIYTRDPATSGFAYHLHG